MTEEENTKKRKSTPLTTSESLSFFLIPIGFFSWNGFKNNDFNESEIERFKQYGFDLKIKQARELTFYGRIFYLSLTIIIVYLLNKS